MLRNFQLTVYGGLAVSLLCPGFSWGQQTLDAVQGLRANEPTAASRSSDAFLRATALQKSGNDEEALIAIDKAIEFDPDCGKCFSLRSGIEADLQKFSEGLADGRLGILRSQTPRDKARAAYNKGINLGALNRVRESLDAYNESIGYDPTYSMGHFGKGKALYLRQDLGGVQSGS